MARRLLVAVVAFAGAAAFSLAGPADRQALPVPGTGNRVVLASGEVWLATPTGRRALGLARYHPWKIAWARVAGRRQLAVGVHKATRFAPRPHNTLFLYDWNDGRIAPRWLGSRLSKPFTDFAFADMRGVGETELASVERLADGRFCVVIYRWTGFGFQGEWQSPPFRQVYRLTAHERIIIAWTRERAKRRPVRFGWLGAGYGVLPEKGTKR